MELAEAPEPPKIQACLGLDLGAFLNSRFRADGVPVRSLTNGLWLSREKDLSFGIMTAPDGRFGLRSGVQVEIDVPAGERGEQFSQELFRDV